MRYLSSTITLTLDKAACNGCRRCVEVCPHGVLEIRERRALIVDLAACMECGACARNCAHGALRVRAGVGCAFALVTSSAVVREPAPGETS
jgi:ferredoxin